MQSEQPQLILVDVDRRCRDAVPHLHSCPPHRILKTVKRLTKDISKGRTDSLRQLSAPHPDGSDPLSDYVLSHADKNTEHCVLFARVPGDDGREQLVQIPFQRFVLGKESLCGTEELQSETNGDAIASIASRNCTLNEKFMASIADKLDAILGQVETKPRRQAAKTPKQTFNSVKQQQANSGVNAVIATNVNTPATSTRNGNASKVPPNTPVSTPAQKADAAKVPSRATPTPQSWTNPRFCRSVDRTINRVLTNLNSDRDERVAAFARLAALGAGGNPEELIAEPGNCLFPDMGKRPAKTSSMLLTPGKKRLSPDEDVPLSANDLSRSLTQWLDETPIKLNLNTVSEEVEHHSKLNSSKKQRSSLSGDVKSLSPKSKKTEVAVLNSSASGDGFQDRGSSRMQRSSLSGDATSRSPKSKKTEVTVLKLSENGDGLQDRGLAKKPKPVSGNRFLGSILTNSY